MPTSTKWENTDSLAYVLAHEYVHIRRFDSIRKLVLIVVLCVHWFNPLVWVMYILANRDIELSCDEAVVAVLCGQIQGGLCTGIDQYGGNTERIDPSV